MQANTKIDNFGSNNFSEMPEHAVWFQSGYSLILHVDSMNKPYPNQA